MDDDPEPILDQMILESHEVNEQLLGFREPKCTAEISDESTLESGDIGPAVDPESPKKPTAVKDLQVQTESKTSIFRRKEWRDQGQQSDFPSSVKSSGTSLRKPSRRSSQRLLGQESRRSSQQPSSQLPPLSQKPSRGQVVNEADTKDPTWVSQRTGKVMTCRGQQTSLIWERKALSEILHPSTDEAFLSKEEESEFTTAEEDFTSSGETASERSPQQESRHGSKQPEGKLSKPSSQQRLERFGSRRSSQRSSELPSTQGPKYYRVRPSKGTDTDEDVTWINQQTGREMKSKGQQTSYIWGSRAHSGVFCSSRRDSRVGQEEESGFLTTDEVPASEETGAEESTAPESCYSSQQEGSVSQRTSWQQLGKPKAHRNSPKTMEQPYLLHLKSSRDKLTKERTPEEQLFWISQATGKEMKCKSQQTSLTWEPQESETSLTEKEDTSEEEERDTKLSQAVEEQKQDIQRTEEQKPELLRRKHKSKLDRTQQTDSAESIRKELADRSQQTDVSEVVRMSLVDLRQDPGHDSEQTDVQGSRRSSQELVGTDSRCSSPQTERRDSQRSSQQSLKSKTTTAEEDEPTKPDKNASFAKEPEETTWVSRKTGRVVRNQSQQTDQSWLRYFALKSQKLKRSISQQTEESFLQRYKRTKLKQALKEHRKNHSDEDVCRCTVCGDPFGEEFPIDLDNFSSFSTMTLLSTISSQETTGEESSEEQEIATIDASEEQSETQLPPPQESQLVGEEEAPKGSGRESQRGSLKAEDDQSFVWQADESESNKASESSSLYEEGKEKIQQSYSVISFKDGIWLNRKTGKLLVSHSQQTSETSVSKVSGTALETSGGASEEGLAQAGVEKEVDRQLPSGWESGRGSQQDLNVEPPFLPGQPTEGSQSSDEVEKLVCRRLSEATLLSIENADVDDGAEPTYTVVSLEEGTWVNVATGKHLASQSQQTEEPSEQNSTENGASSNVPSQRPPEERQVDIP